MPLTQREKWLLASFIGIIALVVASFYYANGSKKSTEEEIDFFLETTQEDLQEDQSSAETPRPIVVDMKGAVEKPGVYTMTEGERVIDVIERAGGLADDADGNAINFASLLTDEMVIYVPKKGEEVGPIIYQIGGSDEEGKIRLNSATAEELQTLQGIGPARATAIISYREEQGPFQSVDDLLHVSGIGPKIFENIKDDLVVD